MALDRASAVLALVVLAAACGGSDSEQRADPLPPSPIPGPTDPGSPVPSADASTGDSPTAQAAEAICSWNRRAQLFELPDPFHELTGPTGYDDRPWKLDKVACTQLEVLGRADPSAATEGPSSAVDPQCPFLRVRTLDPPQVEAWTNVCLDDQVHRQLPPIPVEPLHPDGGADLAFGTPRPTYHEGDSCSGYGAFSGWDVLVENRGNGTTAPTISVGFDPDRGRTTRFTYHLMRGIEPGESFVIGHGENASTVTLDPRAEFPDADRSNNRLELGYTEVFIC